MKTVFTLSVVLLMTGCATCRNHPVACGVASAIIVGSIAATVDAATSHSHRSPGCDPELVKRGIIGSCPIALP